VGVLIEVLEEFENQLRVVRWDQIEDSGTITTQLTEEITKSRFGICYLSEPQDDASRFADNPNVVFEAGMLHALAALSPQERSGWIPIREEKSLPTPFDFAGERIEVVPRGGADRLNEARFRTRLRARLQNLLRG
jgi:predicted nucleotide-binding protein